MTPIEEATYIQNTLMDPAYSDNNWRLGFIKSLRDRVIIILNLSPIKLPSILIDHSGDKVKTITLCSGDKVITTPFAVSSGNKIITTTKLVPLQDFDLTDYDQVQYCSNEIFSNEEYILYRDAVYVLWQCTNALEIRHISDENIRFIGLHWSRINQAAEAKEIVIEEGRRIRKLGGIQSGVVRHLPAEQKWASWQAEAEKIWKKNPILSNRDVAKKVAKKIGGTPETIRKKIKKPLP